MNKRLLIVGLAVIVLAGVLLHIINTEPTRKSRFMVRFETKTISQGAYSGHPEQASYIIDNQEDWQELWQKTTAKIWPAPPLPEVDFDNYMLLARFMGERTSGGYRVEFVVVLEAEEKVYAAVLETSPGPDCLVTAAMTQPYHVVQIPRTKKEIVFNILETVRRCST